MDDERMEIGRPRVARADGWLFIDMADLGDDATNTSPKEWLKLFPGCRIKGSRQKLVDGDWESVTHISVAHTPIGKTILDRCPNLQWVMIRGHASNCVNLSECKRRGVGVISAGAFTVNCAEYIVKHVGPKPWVLFGFGRIGMAVATILGGVHGTITSMTSPDDVENMVKTAGTIMVTVPPPRMPRPPVFGKRLLSLCRDVKLVSISHEPVFNWMALLESVENHNVGSAVLDTVDDGFKDRLLATGRVMWTADSAWKTNFKQAEFVARIRGAIEGTQTGIYDGILVPR